MGTSYSLHIYVVLPENLVVSECGIYYSVCCQHYLCAELWNTIGYGLFRILKIVSV